MGLEKKYEYDGNKYISIGIESDIIKENASEVLDNVKKLFIWLKYLLRKVLKVQ